MTWTRRDFLCASLGLAAAGVLPRNLAAARELCGVGAVDFRELRRNVGIFTSRGGTIGWLVNDAGAAVVDSQYPDTARPCIDGLGDRTTFPFDALINTHHHADHTGGNGVFRDVVRRIVAHDRVPELQRQAAGGDGAAATQLRPDTTFEREWELEIGDEVVRARHYEPAHTGGDCTVFFARANVVHLGDLVFNRAYPFVDRPGGASMVGWVATLEAIVEEHSADAIYVFGHARPGFEVWGRRADVLVQRDFLAAVLERARRAIAEGRSREEATALERLPDFPDHEALNERLNLAMTLGVAYDELSEGTGSPRG